MAAQKKNTPGTATTTRRVEAAFAAFDAATASSSPETACWSSQWVEAAHTLFDAVDAATAPQRGVKHDLLTARAGIERVLDAFAARDAVVRTRDAAEQNKTRNVFKKLRVRAFEAAAVIERRHPRKKFEDCAVRCVARYQNAVELAREVFDDTKKPNNNTEVAALLSLVGALGRAQRKCLAFEGDAIVTFEEAIRLGRDKGADVDALEEELHAIRVQELKHFEEHLDVIPEDCMMLAEDYASRDYSDPWVDSDDDEQDAFEIERLLNKMGPHPPQLTDEMDVRVLIAFGDTTLAKSIATTTKKKKKKKEEQSEGDASSKEEEKKKKKKVCERVADRKKMKKNDVQQHELVIEESFDEKEALRRVRIRDDSTKNAPEGWVDPLGRKWHLKGRVEPPLPLPGAGSVSLTDNDDRDVIYAVVFHRPKSKSTKQPGLEKNWRRARHEHYRQSAQRVVELRHVYKREVYHDMMQPFYLHLSCEWDEDKDGKKTNYRAVKALLVFGDAVVKHSVEVPDSKDDVTAADLRARLVNQKPKDLVDGDAMPRCATCGIISAGMIKLRPCPGSCGGIALHCSPQCRVAHWNKSHKFECVGGEYVVNDDEVFAAAAAAQAKWALTEGGREVGDGPPIPAPTDDLFDTSLLNDEMRTLLRELGVISKNGV